MSIALAHTIHRLATDPHFRAELQAHPELLAPLGQGLTVEDRTALLDVIEAALQHEPALSSLLPSDDTATNWPVNASFTAAAIA